MSAVNPAIWGSAHRCLTPQQPPAPLTPSTEPGPPHNPPRRKTNARPVPMPTEAARSPPGAQHRAGGRCLHPAAPLSPAAFPPTSSSSPPPSPVPAHPTAGGTRPLAGGSPEPDGEAVAARRLSVPPGSGRRRHFTSLCLPAPLLPGGRVMGAGAAAPGRAPPPRYGLHRAGQGSACPCLISRSWLEPPRVEQPRGAAAAAALISGCERVITGTRKSLPGSPHGRESRSSAAPRHGRGGQGRSCPGRWLRLGALRDKGAAWGSRRARPAPGGTAPRRAAIK